MHAQTSFGISVFRHHTTMDANWLMNQAILFFLAPKPLLRTYQTSGSYPQWKTFFLLLCQRVLKLCFLFACSPQVKKQMELCSLIYHALAPLSNVLGLLIRRLKVLNFWVDYNMQLCKGFDALNYFPLPNARSWDLPFCNSSEINSGLTFGR